MSLSSVKSKHHTATVEKQKHSNHASKHHTATVEKQDQSNQTQNLKLFDNGGNGSTASNSGVGYGMTFGGKNDKGKKQNDTVYNNLDSKAKEIIKSTIGNNAWVNPAKIAKALNGAGVQATTGKTSDATYLEITNADGSKSRIWDVGSDGGIGTQDIDFNDKLTGSINDIKGSASTASGSTAVNSTSNVTSNATVDAVKQNSVISDVQSTVNSNKLQKTDNSILLNHLVDMLRTQGYSNDESELMAEAKRLLPYYNSTLS